MTDTIYRQWVILSKIPRFPHCISTPELQGFVANQGFKASIRTIQRDLDSLSVPFPLNYKVEGKKHYWYWMEGVNVKDLPGMDPVTALAFQMAESYLTPILPSATLNLLKPYINRAKEVLNSSKLQLRDWSKKVIVIDRGISLISPAIIPNIQNIIYQGLLEEKQLKITYTTRHSQVSVEYIVHPLGVVNRQGIIYLVCTFWKYNNINQLALHRVNSVELLKTDAILLDGFNLTTYVQSDHEFSYPISPDPIQLKVLFTSRAAKHLYETPLMEDQKLSEQQDGRVLLEGSIIETHELRWWLSGFNSEVKVLEPDNLRMYFAKEAQLIMQRYQ